MTNILVEAYIKKEKLTIFVYTSLDLAEIIVKVESVDICLLLPCHPAWGSRVDATHINSYKQKNTFLVQRFEQWQ